MTIMKGASRREFVQGMAAGAMGAAAAGCLGGSNLAAAQSQTTGRAEAEKPMGREPGAVKKENLVASCGLYCGACPMYLATQENNEEALTSILASMQNQFESGSTNLSNIDVPKFINKISREDLLCDGCLGGGRLASFCRECAIRESAAAKTGTRRCSECAEFACGRITGFNNDGMPHHAETLENLRQLRAMGINDWVKYEENRWRCPQCQARISWYDAECPKCKAPRSARLYPLK